MTKKLFALFIAICFMSFAVAANASEWTYTTPEGTTEDGGSYEITYNLEGLNNTDIEELDVSDIVAGGNFQAIYTLPQLGVDVDFSFIADGEDFEVEPFSLSGNKINYKWSVIGPTVDGHELANSNLVCSLDSDKNILIITGILPDLDNQTISYDVVATIDSIVTDGVRVNTNDNYNAALLKTIAKHAVGTSFDSEITINFTEK
ncbi:MAG: hypothetical protein IJ859_07545, partial [Synergistaceae bacterium]|nr:hypothetical protein [Synergistaceae bacterium]